MLSSSRYESIVPEVGFFIGTGPLTSKSLGGSSPRPMARHHVVDREPDQVVRDHRAMTRDLAADPGGRVACPTREVPPVAVIEPGRLDSRAASP